MRNIIILLQTQVQPLYVQQCSRILLQFQSSTNSSLISPASAFCLVSTLFPCNVIVRPSGALFKQEHCLSRVVSDRQKYSSINRTWAYSKKQSLTRVLINVISIISVKFLLIKNISPKKTLKQQEDDGYKLLKMKVILLSECTGIDSSSRIDRKAYLCTYEKIGHAELICNHPF